MKKLILTLVISCFIIMLFAVPVFATMYSFSAGGGPTKIHYDLTSVSDALILNAINEACGTTENVYYICRVDPQNTEYLNISIMLDVEVQGIKGNVAYVFDDNHGLYTDSFNTVPYWKRIYISNNGSYMSRYTDAGGTPWNNYPNSGSDQYGPCVVITNMPIFRTKEGLDDYFATGNTSDMIGAEPEYDSSMPKVENAYVSYKIKNAYGETDFYLNFDFPDTAENMTAKCYWQLKGDFYNNYFLFSDKNPNGKKLDTTIMELVDIPYQANSVNYLISYDFISKYIIDNYGSSALGGFVTWSDSFKLTELIFYIQIEDDSRKGDIVKVTFDCQNMTSKLSELGVNHVANGSSGTVDNGGDISSADSSNTVDNRDFKDYADITESSIMDYIKSGFGLVGDDGLIPLLGSVFGFLPRPIIIIMTSTFAIISVVIIAKFVRG